MNIGGTWSNGCIHDVSDRGLLISSAEPPRIGTYVDIRRGTLVIIGRVVWSGGRRFGVRTQDPVSLAALVSEPVLKTRPVTADRRGADRKDSGRLQTVRRIAARAERSRRWSSAFQFACLTIVGLGMAYFVAISCYRAFAPPLDTAADVLDGAVSRPGG